MELGDNKKDVHLQFLLQQISKSQSNFSITYQNSERPQGQ